MTAPVALNSGVSSEPPISKPRDLTADIAKGLLILLVVYGHAIEIYSQGFVFRFIYLFHMSVFFILSGVFFGEKYVKSTSSFFELVKKRVKSLLVPYLFFNVVFLLLHNFFLDTHLLPSSSTFFENLDTTVMLNEVIPRFDCATTAKHLLWTVLLAKEQFFVGTTWFLKALFFISVCYAGGRLIVRRFAPARFEFPITAAVCLLCLCAGYFAGLADFSFYKIGTMLSCVFLFAFGNFLSVFKIRLPRGFWAGLISFCALVFITVCNPKFFYISRNFYNNPFWFAAASFFGYVFVMSAGGFLAKFKITATVFSFLGRHTVSILCLHLLSFKVFTLFELLYLNRPLFMLEAYETLYTNYLLAFGYVLVGTLIPVVISQIYARLKKHCGQFGRFLP